MTTTTESSPTGPISKLATELRAAREAARRAKIAGAKTNHEALMAAGVIVTEDDARDSSYRYEYQCKIATALGIRPDEAGELLEQANAESDVVLSLRNAVVENETQDERRTRVALALAAEPLGTKDDGKVCRHNSTKREQGWRWAWHDRETNDEVYLCNRCGAKAHVASHPKDATPGALAALRTLAKAADHYRAVGDRAKAEVVESCKLLAGSYWWGAGTTPANHASTVWDAWRVGGVSP